MSQQQSPERRRRAPPVKPLSHDALRASEVQSFTFATGQMPAAASPAEPDSVIQSPEGGHGAEDAPSVVVSQPDVFAQYSSDGSVASGPFGPPRRVGTSAFRTDAGAAFSNATQSFDQAGLDGSTPDMPEGRESPPPPMINNFLGLRQEADLRRFEGLSTYAIPTVLCAVDEEVAGAFAVLMASLSAAPPDDETIAHCFRECVARIPTILERVEGRESVVSVNAEAGLRKNAESVGGLRAVSFREGPMQKQVGRSGGVTLELLLGCLDALIGGCLGGGLVSLSASTAEAQVRLEDLGRTLVDEWPVVRGRSLSPARASMNLVRGSSARFLSTDGGNLGSVGQFTTSIDISDDNAEAVAVDFLTNLRSWCALMDDRASGQFTVTVAAAAVLGTGNSNSSGGKELAGAIIAFAVVAAVLGLASGAASAYFGYGCLVALAAVPVAVVWAQRTAQTAALASARAIVARYTGVLAVAGIYRTPVTGGSVTPRSSPFTKGPPGDASFSETDVLRSGFLLSKRSQATLNGTGTGQIPGSLLGSIDGDFTQTSVAQRRGSATPNPLSQMLEPEEDGVVRVRMDATGTLLLPFMDDTSNPIVLDGFHVHTHLSVIGVEFSTVYATADEQRTAAIPDDRCYVCLWNHAIVSATGGFTDQAVLSNNLNDVLEDSHSVRALAQRIASIESEVLEPRSGFSNAPLVLSFLHREHGAIKMRMTVAPVTQTVVNMDGVSCELMVGALLIGVPIDVRASLGSMTLRSRFLAESIEQFYLEATAAVTGESAQRHLQHTESNEVTFASLLEGLAKVEPIKDADWCSVNSRCLLQELPRAMETSAAPVLVQIDPIVPEVIDIDLVRLTEIAGAVARIGTRPQTGAGSLVSVSTPNATSSVLMVRVVGCDLQATMAASQEKNSRLVKLLRDCHAHVMVASVPVSDLADNSMSGNALVAQRSLESSVFAAAMSSLEALSVGGEVDCLIVLLPYRRSTGGEVGWLAHLNAAEASDSPVLRRQGSLRVGASMSMSTSLANSGGLQGSSEPMSVMVCRAAEIERHKIALALWHRSHSVVQIEDDDFFNKGHRIVRSGMRRTDAIILSRQQPLTNELLRFCAEFPDVAIALEHLDSLPAPGSLPGSRMRRRSLQSGSASDVTAPQWAENGASGSLASGGRPMHEIVLESLRLLPNVVVVTRPSHAPRFATDLVQAVSNVVRALRGEVKKREAMESLLKQRRSMPWEKGRRLGKGTFGDVHEAKMKLTGGTMAVKTMRCGNNLAKQEALLNEIKVLLAVQHPNIVHYFHSERGAEGEVNIFMELCSGGSLAGLLTSSGHLDTAEVASFLQQMIAALEYMHVTHNLAHRDLKPANVLLSNGKVKLADFGTAAVTKSELTDLAGTMQYMAPEVFAGAPYGKPCDIWSTGVICIDLLRIVPPVLSKPHIACLAACDSDEDLWDGLDLPSDTVRQFLRRCLRVNPADRATATELLRDPFLTAPIHAYGLDTKEAVAAAPTVARRESEAGALSLSGSDDGDAAGDDGFSENKNQWKSRFMNSTTAPSPAKGAAHRLSRASIQALPVAASPAARAKKKRPVPAPTEAGERTLPVPPTPSTATAQPSPAAAANAADDDEDVFADVRNDNLVVQDSVLSDF